MAVTFKKDPSEVLDYTIRYNKLLKDDTITNSTWSTDLGITTVDSTNTTVSATIWLSGGVVDTRYEITNTITTTQGRTYQRSFYIRCEDK